MVLVYHDRFETSDSGLFKHDFKLILFEAIFSWLFLSGKILIDEEGVLVLYLEGLAFSSGLVDSFLEDKPHLGDLGHYFLVAGHDVADYVTVLVEGHVA